MIKEGRNVLFNDPINTFYFTVIWRWTQGKEPFRWVKMKPSLHGLLFPISSKGYFIGTIPKTGYHIPRSLLHHPWSTGWNEIKLNGSTMKVRCDDRSHHEWTLISRSYIYDIITSWIHYIYYLYVGRPFFSKNVSIRYLGLPAFCQPKLNTYKLERI